MKNTCPVCDAKITLSSNVEESEIVTCPDCQSRLVVEKNDKNDFILNQAPEVEEDWGE